MIVWNVIQLRNEHYRVENVFAKMDTTTTALFQTVQVGINYTVGCHGTCKSCKGPGEFECTSCPDLTVLNAKGNCEAKVVPPDPDPGIFSEISSLIR
jgi:hypothetical protein